MLVMVRIEIIFWHKNINNIQHSMFSLWYFFNYIILNVIIIWLSLSLNWNQKLRFILNIHSTNTNLRTTDLCSCLRTFEWYLFLFEFPRWHSFPQTRVMCSFPPLWTVRCAFPLKTRSWEISISFENRRKCIAYWTA